MFIGVGQHPPHDPVMFGPFRTFAEAAAAVTNACCIQPLVIEFSEVYGWLSIWEGLGEHFELLRESSASVVLESGREPAPVSCGGKGPAA